ncbi:MAG: transketolase family protein [Planctomycetota bacterium]|jgi:transketolase|nr:transketolase family protein [Planctomycetota bacterium]
MAFQTEPKEMREVYCQTLSALAEKDERLVVVEADLMRAVGTLPFRDRFPDRSFDVGIAEANMVGVAAGLAACGKVPFVHTFGPFAARRACDQVTISAAYSKLSVKVVGADPGVSSELNGGTHMALEDTAIMRVIPTMLVYEAVDNTQLAQALPQIVAHDGPCYLRLFRKKCPKVFDSSYKFTLGKADVIQDGSDLAIFASGLLVHKSLEAAAELANAGIKAAVINIHTIKPLDADCVISFAKRCGAVVTAENNSKLGGLGGAVCELLSETVPTPVTRVGVNDRFGEVGLIDYLYKALEVDVPNIVAAAKKAVGMKRK